MQNSKKKIKIKIPFSIYSQVMEDLRRPHPFAFERVGFLFSRQIEMEDCIMVLITEYHTVADKNYIKDRSVGAMINSAAIREAMQIVLDKNCGCFHVHLHDHNGIPAPSAVDRESLPRVIESFSNVDHTLAHGMLILSRNSAYAAIKTNKEKRLVTPDLISIIGYPMKFIFPVAAKKKYIKIFDRQTFLGENSQVIFGNIQVGIVGYGGGGSHIGQQLAHLGIERIVVFDEDRIEDTNLNRLIGAWFRDIKVKTLKINVAKRVIKKILPSAKLVCIVKRWEDKPELLQQCDVVFGCLDSYSSRHQLEAECRRFLIPYIDIGMDVQKVESRSPYMSGQIILSMPGMACMNCMRFLTDKKLTEEGAKYGAVGGRPQVVWANGVLASTAIGIFVDLVTGWTGQRNKLIYLSYDANLGVIKQDIRVEYVSSHCEHYRIENIGPVKFIQL